MRECRPVHDKSSYIKKNNREKKVTEKSQYFSLGILDSVRKIWRAFRQENIVFIILCIYLIFEYNRPHLVYPVINIIPWSKTLLIFGAFLAFLDKTCRISSISVIWTVIFFSISVFLSMVYAHSPSVAVDQWDVYFVWVYVILLFISVVNTKKRLFLFVCIYFLINLKMSQHGFKSWAMHGFGFSSWGVTGSPGWFQNSGEFSMQMAVFLPLVISYIITFKRMLSTGVLCFFLLLVLLSVGSIIASGSRGGVLGLIMVGIWLFIFSKKRKSVIFMVSVASFLIYFAIPNEFIDRFKTLGEDETSISRLVYWEYGKKAILENPLTGVGFRNWTSWINDEHPEVFSEISGLNRIEVIHNTYLEVATELGILGFASYALILLQILILNMQSRRLALVQNDSFLEATSVGFTGSLVVYLVPSFFMSVLYYPFIWILYAFSVSLFLILKKS